MRRTLIALMSALILSIPATSQGLKNIPDDASVTRLTLPDGIPCFLVSNTTEGTCFDAAIVQKKSGCETVSNKMLSNEELLHGTAFERVLVRNGMKYGTDGIIDKTEEGNIIRFSGFESTRPEAATDTLLYAMVSFIGKCIKDDPVMFGTDNQAIVLAGNFDKASFSSKLKMYSMNVPAHKSSGAVPEPYEWKDKELSCTIEKISDPFTELTFRFSSPRCKAEEMNTVLPPVTRGMSSMACIVARNRISKSLKKSGIPFSRLDAEYTGSSDWASDELITITLGVPQEFSMEAVGAVASALGDLDRDGAGQGELAAANGEFWGKCISTVNNPTSNASWIDRCANAFFFGADLASEKDKLGIFIGADLDSEKSLKLFNNFTKSVLACDKNLNISYRSRFCNHSEQEIISAFKAGWTPENVREDISEVQRAAFSKGRLKDYDIVVADTSKFVGPGSGKGVKVKKTAKEIASGGTQWTFPGGMKVTYKNAATGGLVFYSLIMNGGRSNIEDAKKGETAFLQDIFWTFNIMNHKGTDFRSILEANRIIMDYNVEYANSSLEGFAPSSKLPMVLGALLTISNSTEVSPDDFDYWYKCEKCRLEAEENSLEGRLARIDESMVPGFLYTSHKSRENMAVTMLERADAFFKLRFSKANDGELVIVTDQSEETVLKTVQSYISGFRTNDALTARATAIYHPVTGENHMNGEGDTESFDMVAASDFLLSLDNVAAAYVAACALEGELGLRLENKGFRVKVTPEFTMAPKERLALVINAGKLPPESRPENSEDPDMSLIGHIISDCLTSMAGTPLNDASLGLYKSLAGSRYAANASYPQHWLYVACKRSEYGKDYNTNYSASFNGVTAEKIRAVMDMLDKGGKISYTVE